jgi:hypothetical protein
VTPITIRLLLARNHFRFCQSPRRAAIPLPDLDDPSDCREPGGGSSGSGGLGAGLHRSRRAAVSDRRGALRAATHHFFVSRSGSNNFLELVMIVWSRDVAGDAEADLVEPTAEPDDVQPSWEPDAAHGAQEPPETSA